MIYRQIVKTLTKQIIIYILSVDFIKFRASMILDFDPRARHSIWACLVGSFVLFTQMYGLSQSSVQRAMSLGPKGDVNL